MGAVFLCPHSVGYFIDFSGLSQVKECMKCKKNQAQLVIRVNDAFCR